MVLREENDATSDLATPLHQLGGEARNLPGHQHQIPPMVCGSGRTWWALFLLVPHLDGRVAPKRVSCPHSSGQHVLADCSIKSGRRQSRDSLLIRVVALARGEPGRVEARSAAGDSRLGWLA